jgi:superfamily I DNA/RNA helicase
MGIREMSSPEALFAANQFIERIKEGRIRKRILTNEGKPFDEGKALERFRDLCESDKIDKLSRMIYGREGRG